MQLLHTHLMCVQARDGSWEMDQQKEKRKGKNIKHHHIDILKLRYWHICFWLPFDKEMHSMSIEIIKMLLAQKIVEKCGPLHR